MHRKESLLRHFFIIHGAPALLAVALSFTGCSRLEEMKTANTNNNTQPMQVATPGSTPASGSTSPASPSAGLPPSAGPAIATADGDLPGIRVEVQELKRTSGDTVTLKFVMINDSDAALSVYSGKFGEEGKGGNVDYRSVGGVHMVDAAGKKKYFVVRDTENQCLCSRDVQDINSKSRAQLWANFPAPPEDVQKITVVVPHFIPMDDVPISR